MFEDTNTPLSENKVWLLVHAANIVGRTPGSSILKSQYLTKCQRTTSGSAFVLPQQLVKSTNRCFRCCVQYRDNTALYQIQPERKKSKFVKKLINKGAKGKPLTRFQEVYLRTLNRKSITAARNNKMVITCGVCKHETKINLYKPKQQSKKTVFEPQCTTKHKNKRKKKDRFSGLNKDIVLSLTPQHKSFNTSDFIPLTSTLNPPLTSSSYSNKSKTKNRQGKGLFPENYNINKVVSGNVPTHVESKNKKMKKNKRTMKNLKNILNNSTKVGSPSVALKQFLNNM